MENIPESPGSAKPKIISIADSRTFGMYSEPTSTHDTSRMYRAAAYIAMAGFLLRSEQAIDPIDAKQLQQIAADARPLIQRIDALARRIR
jgi:hypothetical protein